MEKRCQEKGKLEGVLLQIEVVARNAVSQLPSTLSDDIAKEWSPKVLLHLQLLKPEIGKAYVKVSQSSPPMPDTLVVEFINSLIDNVKDLLSYLDPSTFAAWKELKAVVTKLRFLRNLLRFAATRCTNHEKLKDLSNLAEERAVEAACLCFMCSSDPIKEDIKEKLAELLQKIKPTTPETREIYVGVLEALSPLTTETRISDPDLASFMDTLQDCLTEIQDDQPSWMASLKVSFEDLNWELTFLSSFVQDRPMKPIGTDKSDDSIRLLLGELRNWSGRFNAAHRGQFTHIQDLAVKVEGTITHIQYLAVKVGVTIFFYFYVQEMAEQELAEREAALVGFLNKIELLKSEIGVPLLNLPEVNIVRIDDLGFITYLSRYLKEQLHRQARPIDSLKRHVQGIADELEFLSSFLKSYGERRNEYEELRNFATRIVTVAYRVEYVIDSLFVGDGALFYHLLWLIDVAVEMKRIRREVMVFDDKRSYLTEPKVVDSIRPSGDMKSVTMLADANDQEAVGKDLHFQNLPDYLRQCFLYLGTFPSNEDIPVCKLIRLWTAEGFIQHTEDKSFEDVAMDYLMDLIVRNLVTVCRTSSFGMVKSCKIHNSLHGSCLNEAKDANLFQLMEQHGQLSTCEHRRLCISSNSGDNISSEVSGPLVRSLALLTDVRSSFPRYNVSSLLHNFKLLRVLDLGRINVGSDFPVELEKMTLLKYLEVRGEMDYIPSSISSLLQLETFVAIGLRGVIALPDSIWKLTNLRHLNINPCVSIENPKYQRNSGESSNLRTLSTLTIERCDYSTPLKRLPCLEKLKCIFRLFLFSRLHKSPFTSLPSTLRILTLSKCFAAWQVISVIGELPNLEVLKLQNEVRYDDVWEVEDEQFPRLKFLKLDAPLLEVWDISDFAFRKLEGLKLHNCKELREIPLILGKVPTLRAIEVKSCRQSVEDSAWKLKESMHGNDQELKVIIIHDT